MCGPLCQEDARGTLTHTLPPPVSALEVGTAPQRAGFLASSCTQTGPATPPPFLPRCPWGSWAFLLPRWDEG